MRTLAGITIISTALLAGCGGEPEPKLVGEMSERSICQTSGYLIRQALGDNFKTARVDCSVDRRGTNGVEIESGYIAPNETTLRYTARGEVNGDRLRLNEIRVHGADDDFIPFREFGW